MSMDTTAAYWQACRAGMEKAIADARNIPGQTPDQGFLFLASNDWPGRMKPNVVTECSTNFRVTGPLLTSPDGRPGTHRLASSEEIAAYHEDQRRRQESIRAGVASRANTIMIGGERVSLGKDK